MIIALHARGHEVCSQKLGGLVDDPSLRAMVQKFDQKWLLGALNLPDCHTKSRTPKIMKKYAISSEDPSLRKSRRPGEIWTFGAQRPAVKMSVAILATLANPVPAHR